jgi:hypothetical protein
MLKAGPVAVAANRIRRVIEIEVDVARTLLLDPALKCSVGCLIIAGVGVSLLNPAGIYRFCFPEWMLFSLLERRLPYNRNAC